MRDLRLVKGNCVSVRPKTPALSSASIPSASTSSQPTSAASPLVSEALLRRSLGDKFLLLALTKPHAMKGLEQIVDRILAGDANHDALRAEVKS